MRRFTWRMLCAAILVGFVAGLWTGGAVAKAEAPAGAQGTAQPVATQNPADAANVNRMTIAGHTIDLPADWSVARNQKGSPQFQFVEPDGTRGICMILAQRITAHASTLDAAGLLKEVCKTFGSETYTAHQLGNRTVAMFDVLQGASQTVTHAIFLDGADVLIAQVHILESTDTARQEEVALQVVACIDAEQLTQTP